MAIILDDAVITVDGVELSDQANQVEINSEKEVHDVTTFGARSRMKALGLGDGTMNIQFFQNYAAGSVDDTLWGIHDDGEEVLITVKASSAATGATNPIYTMTGILPQYTPLNGEVGAPSTITANFENAAQAGIQRLITDPAPGSGSGSGG